MYIRRISLFREVKNQPRSLSVSCLVNLPNDSHAIRNEQIRLKTLGLNAAHVCVCRLSGPRTAFSDAQQVVSVEDIFRFTDGRCQTPHANHTYKFARSLSRVVTRFVVRKRTDVVGRKLRPDTLERPVFVCQNRNRM